MTAPVAPVLDTDESWCKAAAELLGRGALDAYEVETDADTAEVRWVVEDANANELAWGGTAASAWKCTRVHLAKKLQKLVSTGEQASALLRPRCPQCWVHVLAPGARCIDHAERSL